MSVKHRVTPAEFWKRVGDHLAYMRVGAGLSWAEVERRGGPAAPTVRDNERLGPKTILAAQQHATALGVEFENLLIAVCRDETPPTTAPQLAYIIERYHTLDYKNRRVLADFVGVLGGQK